MLMTNVYKCFSKCIYLLCVHAPYAHLCRGTSVSVEGSTWESISPSYPVYSGGKTQVINFNGRRPYPLRHIYPQAQRLAFNFYFSP